MKSEKISWYYWLCQFLGWAAYFTFFSVTLSAYSQEIGPVIRLQFTIVSTSFLITHGLRTLYKHYNWKDKPLSGFWWKLLLILLAASLLAQLIIHAILIYILNPADYQAVGLSEFFFYTGNIFVIFAIWTAIYFGYHFRQNNKRKERENWQLKARLDSAELTILKSQINPHFLFNALNNIRSLVISDPEKSRDMITHLSELMRYFIQFNKREKVPVSQEAEVVKDYLALEKIQFEDRLLYSMDIDHEIMSCKIPPMSIQLLVENAIKHGISGSPTGGIINISVTKDEESLDISVINTGQISQDASDSGTGLKNLSDRMKLIFRDVSDITLRNLDASHVKASLRIPL